MCPGRGTRQCGWSAVTNGVQFKLHLPGLNKVMKSGEMLAVVRSAAQQMAAAANAMGGGGYEAWPAAPLSFDGVGRVSAATAAAKADNREHNTLLKAAGGVRV